MVRLMAIADLTAVVSIHMSSFPTSRSTKLGGAFLRKMYEWYVLKQPDLSFVALLDGEIIGFVTGSLGGMTANRRFQYAFWQIVWGFLCHPSLLLQPAMYEAWHVHLRMVLKRLRRSRSPQYEQPAQNGPIKVSLDSLAVSPAARGQAIGRQLVHVFEGAAQKQGVNYMALGVESDNLAARRLYENCGWQLVAGSEERNAVNYTKHFQVS